MQDFNFKLSIALAALAAIASVIAVIPSLKTDPADGQSKQKLTRWGKLFLAFTLMFLIGSLCQIYLNNDIRKVNEARATRDSTNNKLFQDSVYKSLFNSGLAFHKGNLTIADLEKFFQRFKVAPIITDSLQRSVLVDTIHAASPATSPPSISVPLTAAPNISKPQPRQYEDDEPHIADTDLGAEGKQYSNSERFTALARCKFINHTSYPITLYYGNQTTILSSIRGVNSASVGRSITTGFGEIGYNMPNGTINPPSAFYNFYFISNTSPKLYGKITVKLSAFKETTRVLDDNNLILTETGDRERYALKEAKLD